MWCIQILTCINKCISNIWLSASYERVTLVDTNAASVWMRRRVDACGMIVLTWYVTHIISLSLYVYIYTPNMSETWRKYVYILDIDVICHTYHQSLSACMYIPPKYQWVMANWHTHPWHWRDMSRISSVSPCMYIYTPQIWVRHTYSSLTLTWYVTHIISLSLYVYIYPSNMNESWRKCIHTLEIDMICHAYRQSLYVKTHVKTDRDDDMICHAYRLCLFLHVCISVCFYM